MRGSNYQSLKNRATKNTTKMPLSKAYHSDQLDKDASGSYPPQYDSTGKLIESQRRGVVEFHPTLGILKQSPNSYYRPRENIPYSFGQLFNPHNKI